jgi:transposase
VLAAIDIHKAVFQAAVLDPDSGEITEERFTASRKALTVWIAKWHGQITVVALEATTGWRWVARELQARGIEVRLTDPGQASALQGNRKRAKTDRLDARWLCVLLAKEMLPSRGCRRRRSRRCATRQGCARRWRRIAPVGRSGCTRC